MTVSANPTLGEQQEIFASMLPRLIDFAYDNGYRIRLGHTYRSPECTIGHPNSLHRKKLAVDLNLFKDGKYLSDSESHKPLGDYWCSLHPENRWGGMEDGNHYSSFARLHGMTF